ncbi:hypothetical protein AKJ16_DCAP22955 [Drosera capensis]
MRKTCESGPMKIEHLVSILGQMGPSKPNAVSCVLPHHSQKLSVESSESSSELGSSRLLSRGFGFSVAGGTIHCRQSSTVFHIKACKRVISGDRWWRIESVEDQTTSDSSSSSGGVAVEEGGEGMVIRPQLKTM